MLKRLLLALLVAAIPTMGFAQQTVLQGGSYSAGGVPVYSGSGGTQPVIQNSGPASGTGVGIKELSVIARGTGTAPFVGQGTGYLGSLLCLYDGPTTGQYHQLCLSPNATGNVGLLSFNAGGGASAIPLSFNVNGVSYPFPFPGTGTVTGPNTSVVNDGACWNNTTGTLLKDCGPISTNPGGTSGQVQYNNAGAFGGFTLGGDGTLVASTGALTISKIGGQNITLGGTLTTAAAFTTSGANALTLTTTTTTNVTMPATGTGTLATLAGSEALTNKTYNGNTFTSGTGTLTISAGKTLTASNTITFAGTDASTLNIGTGGTLGTAAFTASTAYLAGGTQITNSLSGNVSLSNTSNYFDGPSVAQGSTGTWFASGTVTLQDTTESNNTLYCKLWDGTTVASSLFFNMNGGLDNAKAVSLSGYITSPAGNIRISCRDVTTTAGNIVANSSGNGKDSTVTAFRVQ